MPENSEPIEFTFNASSLNSNIVAIAKVGNGSSRAIAKVGNGSSRAIANSSGEKEKFVRRAS
jgi:hypothetical protein